MTDLLELVLAGFWKFIGFTVIFYILIHYLANFPVKIWSRFMRMLMVRKHGWPPSHLDADGDWPEIK
jgi:hypothetical protein